MEPHLIINKLRTKRWKMGISKKREKKCNTKGIIILWWSVQLNLSCVYDLRKVDWTCASKKQRPEHLQTEMNGYCQIVRRGWNAYKWKFSRRDWKKWITVKHQILNLKKINGIVFDIHLLGKYNTQYQKS